MSPKERSARPLSLILVTLGVVVACSLPRPGPSEPEEPAPPEPPVETVPPASEVPAAEPMVVTHQGSNFNVYTLGGALVETRAGTGMAYPRPNTAQVVGDAIYYVDSAGSTLGGVIRRVTSAGTETLDFTAAEVMASTSFAVSGDGSRIAWSHATAAGTGMDSQLWIADIDGSDAELIAQSGPDDGIEDFYVLEAVRWTPGGDLIYAWQISGIGGYILFFGWSSFYRYSPATAASTPLIAAGAEGTGPCWYTVSSDLVYAVGGCDSGTGVEGMRERELAGGGETVFPVLPDQGQEGAAAYSPSGERLAYAVARGDFENEGGQVVVRLSRGEAPVPIASHSPAYFYRILWVDEERMVVGYSEGEAAAVDLLGLTGTRTPIGDGQLIGLLWPSAPAAVSGEGLPDQVRRGELTVERVFANGDIAGPGIQVVVRNPGPEDLETIIPCGFVFVPDDSRDQRLMAVQASSATVPAGGEATLTVYVVCIDSSNAVPSDEAGYALGEMQSGDLLRLAQCACGEDLAGSMDPMAGIAVMTAGWMISNGQSFTEMMSEESEGALSEFMGGEMAQALSGFLEMIEVPAYEWLDRCNIQLP